jgi:endonuclease YncB( thermonuclease family)
VAEKDDISMPELARELQAASGVKADPASLSRWLIRNGLTFKTYGPPRSQRMARPVRKGFFRDRRLISLLQRIRPRRSILPAKMEIRALRSS